MLFASSDDREKVEAYPGGRAFCPGCGGVLIAKCGDINIWHWSHESGADCDLWFEGESPWHVEWKRRVRPARCEMVLGPHRADIVGLGRVVIELQHSPLSPFEVRRREAFYKKMIWLVDASEFRRNLKIRNRGDYVSFRWKWPRKWQSFITQPLFWDFGDGGDLLQVRMIGDDVPCGGWGMYVPRDVFLTTFLGCYQVDPTEAEAL